MESIPTTPGIYAIRNLINGHIYVGSTGNLRKRSRQHFVALRRGVHKNPHLQSAFGKYGQDFLVFEVLEHVEVKEHLIKREQHYIDLLNPIYNIHRIADSPLGVKRSDETRAKLREIAKEQWRSGIHSNPRPPVSEETRRKLSARHKGKKLSPSQKEALLRSRYSEKFRASMSMAQRGRKHSTETRAKIAAAHLGKHRKPFSEEAIRNMSKGQIGRVSPNKGKKFSEEHRAKMSESHKLDPNLSLRVAKAHEGRRKHAEERRIAKEQEYLTKEQRLLACWEQGDNTASTLDPSEYRPMSLWDRDWNEEVGQ